MVTFKQFVLESVPGYGDPEPTSKYPEGKPKLAWIEVGERKGINGWHFFDAAGNFRVTVKSRRRALDMKTFLLRRKRWKFKGQSDIDF
tara:strand:- start:45 stop:308 length:264 start_codon:yes stop_codon:yes gene_type:complete